MVRAVGESYFFRNSSTIRAASRGCPSPRSTSASVERAAGTVLLEVRQSELKVRLLRAGVRLDRFLELVDRLADLAELPLDLAEQDSGRGQGRDVARDQQLALRFSESGLPGEQTAES